MSNEADSKASNDARTDQDASQTQSNSSSCKFLCGGDAQGQWIDQSSKTDQDADSDAYADQDATNGSALTGTQQAAQGSGPLENGKVEGNNVSWSAKISSPMPLTLDFTGTVEGDKLSGSVKAGSFGSFPFTGNRTA